MRVGLYCLSLTGLVEPQQHAPEVEPLLGRRLLRIRRRETDRRRQMDRKDADSQKGGDKIQT